MKERKRIAVADVAAHFGIPFDKAENVAECPVCGKKKLYISSEGCFYCHHDGFGGKGAVALFHLFDKGEELPKDLPRPEYLKEVSRMREALGADDASFRSAEGPAPAAGVPLQPPETVDAVFRDIIAFKRNIHKRSGGDGSGITAKHRKALRKRGFVHPERYGIVSIPSRSECNRLYKILKKKYGGRLTGVPGFYDGGMALWGSGIMIPVADGKKRYATFQMRLDDPGKAGKYIYLSSNGKKGGCSCGSPAHIAGEVDQETTDIIFTEGCLKGDLINEFTGVPVCAFQGVNSLGDLPRILPTLAAIRATVHIAFDMDATENKNVLKAKKKLIEALEREGITYEEIVWPIERGKGYDDFLLSCRKRGLL